MRGTEHDLMVQAQLAHSIADRVEVAPLVRRRLRSLLNERNQVRLVLACSLEQIGGLWLDRRRGGDGEGTQHVAELQRLREEYVVHDRNRRLNGEVRELRVHLGLAK
jgi:hypothetical protein